MSVRASGVLAALFVALLPGVAAAQSAPGQPAAQQAVNNGSVSGLVRDSLGGAIPGASIRVVNESTNAGVDVVTDAQGVYRVADLVPGPYRLEVTLSGFETILRRFTLEPGQTPVFDISLVPSRLSEGVIVTARRVEEVAQEVPIPVSVVSGDLLADTGASNVGRLAQVVPTVQFYSSNPRNTAINIRGLGAPFGLTNDGIEPGVGLYVDGVFYSRPASTTLDFLDVERVEVLRGPQGTLFGKNTTAGAINVTTKRPTFAPEADLELNYGTFGFIQAKASVSGPLGRKVAGRLSFSGTQRDGLLYNVATDDDVNDQNNLGVRGQLLYTPSERLAITVAVDNTRQRPEGHAQVIAGVAPTLRAANRQWAAIIADLGYTPPSYNAFDRVTDTDTPWRSKQDLGGASLNIDWNVGRSGQLTSTTAWRYWNWDPSNDRDFIGLPVTTVSAAPSTHRQWTQEVRYAGDVRQNLQVVVGAFVFGQSIDSDPFHKQEQGAAAARFLLAPSAQANTPGLLDGYGQNTSLSLNTVSAALFGQLSWELTDRLRLLPGLRWNYDQKDMTYENQVYGGLQTNDPVLISLQRSVLSPQAYAADVDDTNFSGQITAAYKVSDRVNAFGTFATSFKSVGLNLGGVPANAAGQPALDAATVKPEDVKHLEFGVKTEPWRGAVANFAYYDTRIDDFQTQVVNAQVGVLRGYLANAEKVRVRGFEFDGSSRIGNNFSIYAAAAWTDGKYVSFTDAPPPLEETGGPQVKDISGSVLPGISKGAVTFGGEAFKRTSFFGRPGELFGAVDASYRSSFSSSPSASQYLMVDGYALLGARAGFRWTDGWSLSIWARNLLNTDYYELLSAAPGNSGLYVGLPGDQRTVGVTLRFAFKTGTGATR
jgi:iron complex outermembrane receptor protein